MKKVIGKLVGLLTLVAVFMLTGCGSLHIGEKSSLSGDVPRLGQVIYVSHVVAHETETGFEVLVVWRPYTGGDEHGQVKVMKSKGCFFSDLEEGKALGYFLVRENIETSIGFQKVEMATRMSAKQM
ncbi:MAG: hypothetical protein WCW14_01475 [Candidatus Paceibacterota bacterium]|jgi:hypothetical protein